MLTLTNHNLYPVSSARFVQELGPVLHHAVAAQPLPSQLGSVWLARSVRPTQFGLHLRYAFRVYDTAEGCHVQLVTHAELSPAAWLVLCVTLLFCWPLAVILGVLAHRDFVQVARPTALAALWPALASATHDTPYRSA